MNIISKVLQEKNKVFKCALIPFITAGYPNISTTIQILHTLDQEGADIIELGIPYADALADGPLIQEAYSIAIKQGIYIEQVLDILEKVRFKLHVPIIIFSYYNPILVRGIHKFILEISNLGVKGLVIPDLPIEEIDYIVFLCSKYNIELILFIAPTTSLNRISNILSKAPGCIYLVSSTGVTGIRNYLNSRVHKLSSYIKSKTNKLVMLGFGISGPAQVSEISKWNIDGIVIGSAFIKIISNYHDLSVNHLILKDLSNFCKAIKSSTKN